MKLNQESGGEPAAVEEVAEGLIRVPLRTPTLPPATRTNTYLVDVGGAWLVVDAGPSKASELERLDVAMRRFIGAAEVAGLLLTHHHRDHVGGTEWWVSSFSAPVYAHARTFEAVPKAYARATARGRRPKRVELVEDAEIGNATALFTEGHARGHFSLRTDASDVLAGDLMAGLGTIVVDPPDGDMSAYFASLRRLRDMPLRGGFPAHGPHDASAHDRIDAYIEHRTAREDRVFAALSLDEPRGLSAVTKRAYDDVPVFLLPMASRSALAHVLKLVDDGRAIAVGDGWRALEP